MEKVIDRVKKLLFKPAEEWPVINAEPGNSTEILKSYLIYLIGAAVAAQFIGWLFIGKNLFSALILAAVYFVLMIVGIYIGAYIINLISPSFGGVRDDQKAFKLVAYSSTASLVGQLFMIIPFLGFLTGLVALYGIYLFYVGAPVILGVPKEKSLLFTLVGILVMIGVGLVAALLTLPFHCA